MCLVFSLNFSKVAIVVQTVPQYSFGNMPCLSKTESYIYVESFIITITITIITISIIMSQERSRMQLFKLSALLKIFSISFEVQEGSCVQHVLLSLYQHIYNRMLVSLGLLFLQISLGSDLLRFIKFLNFRTRRQQQAMYMKTCFVVGSSIFAPNLRNRRKDGKRNLFLSCKVQNIQLWVSIERLLYGCRQCLLIVTSYERRTLSEPTS